MSPNRGKKYELCAGCGKRGLRHKPVPFIWTPRYDGANRQTAHPQDSLACRSCEPVPAVGRISYSRVCDLAVRLLGRRIRWATETEAQHLAAHPARRVIPGCPACGVITDSPGAWDQGFHGEAVAFEHGSLRMDSCVSCGHTYPAALILRKYPDPDIPAALVMMIGAPGSGKSTWRAKRFGDDQVFNADELRGILTGDPSNQDFNSEVFAVQDLYMLERMRCGMLTVADATNTRQEHRATLIRFARTHGVTVIGVLCHPPLEVVLERNQGRDRVVPDEVVRRMHGNITASLPTLPMHVDYLVVVGDLPEAYQPESLGPWLHYHPYAPGRTYTIARDTPDLRVMDMIAAWTWS